MIQKIRSSEYLKRMDNMTAVEKEDYLKSVGEWLQKKSVLLVPKINDHVSQFQNVLQVSANWNDAECQAWSEGARMLTALVATEETWLPDMLYAKAAKRSVRQMIKTLQTISVMEVGGNSQDGKQPTQKNIEKIKATEPAAKVITLLAHREGQGVSISPVRPKHIDQYVHLLPAKTQEKAATVKGLLRELDVARERMRLLADDPKASDTSRAQWASAARDLDKKVKAIYKELDDEWEKLVQSGRVVVDDLGNAQVVEIEKEEEAAKNPETESKKDDTKAEEENRRREYLKKWLRDTRATANDERRKQWEKNCEELLQLGGEMTDSIRKAAAFYGVTINTPGEQTTNTQDDQTTKQPND